MTAEFDQSPEKLSMEEGRAKTARFISETAKPARKTLDEIKQREFLRKEAWYDGDTLDDIFVNTFINRSLLEEIVINEEDRMIIDSGGQLLHEVITPQDELAHIPPPDMPEADIVAEHLKERSMPGLVAAAVILKSDIRPKKGKVRGAAGRVIPAVADIQRTKPLANLRNVTNRILEKEYGSHFYDGAAPAIPLLAMAIKRLSAVLPRPSQLEADLRQGKLPEDTTLATALVEMFNTTWKETLEEAQTTSVENFSAIPEPVRKLYLAGIPAAITKADHFSQHVPPSKRSAFRTRAISALVVANFGEAEKNRLDEEQKKAKLPSKEKRREKKQKKELHLSKEYNSEENFLVSPNELAQRATTAIERANRTKYEHTPKWQEDADTALTSIGVLFERSAFDSTARQEFNELSNESLPQIISLLYTKYVGKAKAFRQQYSQHVPAIVDFSPGDALIIDSLSRKPLSQSSLAKKMEFLKEMLLRSAYDNFNESAYERLLTSSIDQGKSKTAVVHLHERPTRNVVTAAYVYSLLQRGVVGEANPALVHARNARLLQIFNAPGVAEQALPKQILHGLDVIISTYDS